MLDPLDSETSGSALSDKVVDEIDLRQKLSTLQQSLSVEQKQQIQKRASEKFVDSPRQKLVMDTEVSERLAAKRTLVDESVQKHQEAAAGFQTQSEAQQVGAETAQSNAVRQKESLRKIEDQNFAEVENQHGDLDALPNIKKTDPDDVTVEIATAVGFSKIDKKILEQAKELFPHEPFDAEGLTSPVRQFKIAVLDGLIQAVPKAKLPGVPRFQDLSKRDRRQLVENMEILLGILNPSLEPGKTFSKALLLKNILKGINMQVGLFSSNAMGPFKVTSIVDSKGVIKKKFWQQIRNLIHQKGPSPIGNTFWK